MSKKEWKHDKDERIAHLKIQIFCEKCMGKINKIPKDCQFDKCALYDFRTGK